LWLTGRDVHGGSSIRRYEMHWLIFERCGGSSHWCM
jgi:hypothetical protein